MAFEGKGTVLGGKSGKESPERIGRIRWEKCLERGDLWWDLWYYEKWIMKLGG